jgi:GABA(A) receptor-associated protein
MEFIQEFRKDDWTKRLAKTQYLREKYPGRVPIIIDRGNTSTPKLTDNRFIVPLETTREEKGEKMNECMTMGKLLHVVRKHMPTLTHEQGLFLFLHEKNVMPPTSSTLSQVYAEHQDRDGFLYITVLVESTFG